MAGAAVVTPAAQAQGAGPLPSWHDGPRKHALLDFVAAVILQGGPDIVVPPTACIAIASALRPGIRTATRMMSGNPNKRDPDGTLEH